MTKRVSKLFAAICLVVPALVLMPSIAAADDTQCNGPLPPGTYDNVVVPAGASCDVRGSNVKGSIKALPGADFLFVSDSTIAGNIEGQKVGTVHVFGLTGGGSGPVLVGGNIDVTEGNVAAVFGPGVTLPNGNIRIQKQHQDLGVNDVVLEKGTIIMNDNVVPVGFTINHNRVNKGNIIVTDNVITAGVVALDIFDNQVAQNLQVFKNTSPGAKIVRVNVVGENLQCFENNPPFVAFGNAANKAEGQCAP